MTKTTSILWVATALTLSGTPAAAQTTKNIFLDVNVGAQVASRSLVVDASQTIYGESAIITSTQEIGSGVLFDVGGGYRVWRDLSIGLGFSRTSNSSDAAVSAAIPHPLFTDRRVTVETTADSLQHSETAYYLQFMWTVPITDKIDASFGIGPALISASQELVSAVTVPPGTQDAVPAPEEQSDTTAGIYIGADLTYLLTPRYGVGGFMRYVGATVGLPSAPELKLGGFQIGGGARFRF